MKQLFKQFWCAVRGHAGIHWTGGRHTLGVCKRCGATVKMDI